MPSRPPKPPKSGADLQASIDNKGFNWRAEKTPLSELSREEQRAHLGLRVTDQEVAAFEGAIAAAEQMFQVAELAAPPPAVDWRDNGGNWITDVKDQKTCGSCVAFAVCATVEARIRIACNDPSYDVDLSEAHLFYCGCGNCCGTGWNFPPALDFAKNSGVWDESSFPYTPANQPCRSGSFPATKISSWTSLLATAERKNTLASKGPIVAGMAVYQDFYSYSGGVYRHATGPLVGYHAICVVGYDDDQQCWICKNSWSASFGEGGFFRIGYGESIDSTFPFFDVDVTCPERRERDVCAQYVPPLVRVLTAAQTNMMLRNCLRYYVCGRGTRPYCSTAQARVVRAVLLVLRECPQYRAPFCRALG